VDTILGILPGESYNGIRTLADLSVYVKYTNNYDPFVYIEGDCLIPIENKSKMFSNFPTSKIDPKSNWKPTQQGSG